MTKIYALYHGDHYLCSGTKAQIARFLGHDNLRVVDTLKSPYYYKHRFMPLCTSYLVIFVCNE